MLIFSSFLIITVAAGFDKNGTAIRGLFDMGFSFVSMELFVVSCSST